MKLEAVKFSNPSLAYLDANILLAKSAGPVKEPRQYPGAHDTFERIKNQEIEVVISPLALMEVHNALRINAGKQTQILAGLTKEERIDYVLKEGDSGYNSIIAELIQMGSSVKFKMKSTVDMNLLLDDAQEIMGEITR